jgi:hypothetical protein
MGKNIYKIPLLLMCFTTVNKSAQQTSSTKNLKQEYNLTPQHSKDTQYYEMTSKCNLNSLVELHRVGMFITDVTCVPSKDPSKGDEYTCLKFTVEINKSRRFQSHRLPTEILFSLS